MQFDASDEADGFGLLPAQPIPLKGTLLTGLLSPDGLTPLTGTVPFRITVKGLSGTRIKDGDWYAPSLVAEAEENGVEFTSAMRTIRSASGRLNASKGHANISGQCCCCICRPGVGAR